MNLPTELLRTFIKAVDLGSFTRAGGTGKFAGDFRTGWYEQTSQQDNGAGGLWGGADASVCK